MEWYVKRGDEKLGDFLEQRGAALFRIPGFGRKKIEALCEIIENLGELDPADGEEVTTDFPRQRLEQWGFPVEFPCQLVAFPARVLHYCERNEIVTVGDLIDEWEQRGYCGLIAERNLGTKSVRAIESLITNLIAGDRESAATQLPLKPGKLGIDFAASLAHVISEQSPIHLYLLERRLVAGLTLEESAQGQECTRERVRQIEAKFLAAIEDRLDYFDGEHGGLLSAWFAEEDWFPLVGWHGTRQGAILAKASLEAIFNRYANGVE